MAYYNDIELQNALAGLLASPNKGGLDVLALLENENKAKPVIPTFSSTPKAPASPESDILQNALVGLLNTPNQGGLAVSPPSKDYLAELQAKVQAAPPEQKAAAVKGESDGLNAGARRVNEEGRKENSAYKPSALAVAAGASPNKVEARLLPNGQVKLTNVGTEVYEEFKPKSFMAASGKDFSLDSVRKEYETIEKEVNEGTLDEVGFAKRIGEVQNNIANYVADKKQALIQAHRATLGIDAMQIQLQQAALLDQKERAVNPNAVPSRSYALAERISKLEKQAEAMADSQLGSNTEVAALDSFVKTRVIADSALAKKVGIISQTALTDAITLQRTPKEVIENIQNVFPDAAKAGPTQMVNAISKLPKGEQELFYAKKEQIPINYLAAPSNQTAKTLLVESLKKQGKPVEDIERIVNRATFIMQDDKTLNEAFKPYYPDPTARQQAILLAKSPKGDATQQNSIRQNTATILASHLDKEATVAFTSDATKWLPKDKPQLQKAVNTVLLAKQPTSLENVANAYIDGGKTLEEKAIRRRELASIIAQQRASSQIYSVGNVDFNIIENSLPLVMTGSRIGNILSPVAEAAADSMKYSVPGLAYNTAVRVGTDIGAAFNWLTEDVPAGETPTSFMEQIYKIDPSRRQEHGQ